MTQLTLWGSVVETAPLVDGWRNAVAEASAIGRTIMRNGKASRFPLGRIVATTTALNALSPTTLVRGLQRHACGDWGEISEDDRLANEEALSEGGRLLSAYTTERGGRFWILTESDRSATTILLPDDY